MANRCLNKVILIGNLTRDPELRYTPNGVAVCSLGLATNRRWKTQDNEYKEEAQFHRVVAWNQLAELCAQLLAKGRRVYIEGRLQYRDFVSQKDGAQYKVAEIIMEDMIILDSQRRGMGEELSEESAEAPKPKEDLGDEISFDETEISEDKAEKKELKKDKAEDIGEDEGKTPF